MAMCAAGPPKAVVPSLRNSRASSPRDVERAGMGAVPCSTSADSAIIALPAPGKGCVQAPGPAPTIRRKSEQSIMDQSVRASWAIFQKPLSSKMGTFVVAMATSMSMIRGIAAGRVKQPDEDERAATDLDHADEGGHDLGAGIPIFANRPTPRASGKRNFWIPFERKTTPTTSRMRKQAAGARVARIERRNVIRRVSTGIEGRARGPQDSGTGHYYRRPISARL